MFASLMTTKVTNCSVKKHIKWDNQKIDEEITKIISEQMIRCQSLVKEKRNQIESLSKKLLEKDVLRAGEVKP